MFGAHANLASALITSAKIDFVFCFYLFNDGHTRILQLRTETIAVLRRMNSLDDYDGQMVSGNKSGLNVLIFVLLLGGNLGKNLNQENDPIGI